ncbi:hypothetical protein PIB30_070726 [Stylosanthes scabra]|uniref:PB1-like domain-containing protein n=1 Tax=Stylosanthes scabra TaxID=79078 RepID=A0ABU6UMZ7_9FABA|nr:hypothetical protein [Stylosanthes scabra]
MGKLKRDSKLNLVYDGGEEKIFDNVNPEKLNLMRIKDLFKGLGYKEYDYMYWVDEELGLNGGGLNMITGDLAVVMMGEWALKHESQVHVYFEHPVNKGVEFVNLEEDTHHVTPQPLTTEDTPRKKRMKMRAKRTPIPPKKAVTRKPMREKKDGAPRIYVPTKEPDRSDSDPRYHGYESEELGDLDSYEEEKQKKEISWSQENPSAS